MMNGIELPVLTHIMFSPPRVLNWLGDGVIGTQLKALLKCMLMVRLFLRYIIYYPMHEADLSKVVAVMRQ